jgi:hypothetical protein
MHANVWLRGSVLTQLTGVAEAAAFHGLATNRAMPITERLECALRALEIYEAEWERINHDQAQSPVGDSS